MNSPLKLKTNYFSITPEAAILLATDLLAMAKLVSESPKPGAYGFTCHPEAISMNTDLPCRIALHITKNPI